MLTILNLTNNKSTLSLLCAGVLDFVPDGVYDIALKEAYRKGTSNSARAVKDLVRDYAGSFSQTPVEMLDGVLVTNEATVFNLTLIKELKTLNVPICQSRTNSVGEHIEFIWV